MDRNQRLEEETRRRLRLRLDCRDDRKAQKTVLATARKRPVRWINDWAWTYDPRNPAKGLPAYLPFRLYPKQRELVRWILDRRDGGENGAIEKARGTGATYTAAAVSAWSWLFEPASSVKWGSRTESDVDEKGNPDSIFEKIRTILYRLPDWMLPEGFERDEHDNLKRLVNPSTGANIIGQQGENMGRGGRSSLYFWDESAFHDHPRKVERSVKENTDCLVEISTHAGPGTPFARKVESQSVAVFRMPWHSVPWRDDTWYASKKQDYAHDPVGFARNVEMDPGGATERVVIPKKFVQAAVDIELEAGARTDAGLDVGESHDLNVFVRRSGPVAFEPKSWADTDTTQTARRSAVYGKMHGVKALFYDAIGVGAGVSGELQNYEDGRGNVGEEALPFEPVGVNVGRQPTRQKWPNGERSEEWLANLKTELWWRLRERFRKTYERLHGDADPPDGECISIPDHPELTAQLSWPRYEIGSGGKYRIESKKRTKKRLDTQRSYDFADSLVLAFAGDVLEASKVNFSQPAPQIR